MDYIIIALVVFLVRIAPVIKSDRVDFDTYGHLYYASAIKEQNKSPWDSIKIQCWSGENFSHPFLVHWILSKIKKEKLLNYQRIINPTLDTLFSLYIYYASQIYFGENKQINIVCVLLYLFTPMWFSKISMGPRVHNFTPRLITEILFPVLIFISLFQTENGSVYNNILYQIIMIILILNATKFGVQVIVFLIPLISLITLSLDLIISLLLALIITIIMSKGKYYNQLKRQILHLIEYYNANKKNETFTKDRNRFVKIDLRKIASKEEIKKIIYCFIYNNSYTAVIIKMPIVVFALVNLINEIKNYQNELSSGSAVVLSTLIIYLAINQRRLLFLGEAERYLNHISIIVIFEAITYSRNIENYVIIYIILIYGLLFWILENLYFRKITNSVKRNLADNEVELILKKILNKKIIYTHSYHNFCVYRIMLNTQHEVIFPYHMENEISKNFTSKYKFNYPNKNLSNLKDMFVETNCSIIIIDNLSFDKVVLNDLKLENEGWNRIKLSHDVYTIYEK